MEDLLKRTEGSDVEAIIKLGTGGQTSDITKLRQLRSQLQGMAESSSNAIRQNVVHNYAQFIETAKEISYLESEMYQLNHLLTQQRDLIEGMTNFPFSVTGQERELKSRQRRGGGDKRSLQTVIEWVEGCGYLSQDSNRYYIMGSELSELKVESDGSAGRKVRQLHVFLLSDSLLICTFLPQRSGHKRYKMESHHLLDSVALLGVEDTARARNVFKIRVFPQHKLFAAENAATKKRWLTAVQSAKQAILHEGSLARQGTIRSKYGSVRGPPKPESGAASSLVRRRSSEEAQDLEDLEWLRELPDEIEVCIAQREFSTCLELLTEGREYLAEGSCPDEAVAKEVAAKLTQKERQLVQVLARELRASGDRSGPKAARKAIQLLIKLGKSSYACDLYLKERRRVLHAAASELRIAEEPLSYLRSLCQLVMGTLAEVSRELPGLFGGNSGCCALLVSWSSGELSHAVHLVLRHVIDPGPSLAVVAQSAKILDSAVRNLAPLGLDLTFQLHALLHPPLLKALTQNEHNILEAARLRLSEDRWRQYNLQNEPALHKLLEEMHEVGLGLDSWVVEDEAEESPRCRLWLSPETVQTGRSALQLSRDAGALGVISELRSPGLGAVKALWDLLLAHLQTGLGAKDKPPAHYRVAESSAKFIVLTPLPPE